MIRTVLAIPFVELLLIAVAANFLAWAAFRLDKVCARRQWRRLPERTLIALALIGGSGALIGMYAHRQRHKTNKTVFVVAVVLAMLLQLAALAGYIYLVATASAA